MSAMKTRSRTSNNKLKCRCCLGEGKHSHSINEEYIKMFKETLNLLITSDCRLPQHICNSCMGSFEVVKRFRNMVMKSETQLLQAFKKSSYITVPKNPFKVGTYTEEEESNTEIKHDVLGDFNSDVPFFNGADEQLSEAELGPIIKDEEFMTITIGSTVVKRIETRLAGRVSNGLHFPIFNLENKNSIPAPQPNEDVEDDEGVKDEPEYDNNDNENNSERNIRESSPVSMQLDGSDSDSDTPLSKFKNCQALVENFEDSIKEPVPYHPMVENDGNSATGEIQFLTTDDINEPKLPKRITIKPDAIASQPLVSDDTKLRQNIILTIKHSTVMPFQHLASQPKYLKCYYCDKLFLHINKLRTHTECEHIGKITDKKLLSLMRERNHKRMNADISIIKCRHCDEKFDTVQNLIQHLTEVHQIVYNKTNIRDQGILGYDLSSGKLKCHLCAAKFERFIILSSHMNTHYHDFICHCGKTFATEVRYQSHLQGHSVKLKCKHCDAEFKSKPGFRYHMQRQHFTGLAKCTKCSKEFKDYATRDKHVREEHPREKELECDICKNGTLYTPHGLYKHMAYLHEKRWIRNRSVPLNMIVCEICGYKNQYQRIMKEHMNVHYGVKNFECDVCKKRFGKKNTLNVHMRLHTNEKRFVCDLCAAAFAQMYSLKYHMMKKHPNS